MSQYIGSQTPADDLFTISGIARLTQQLIYTLFIVLMPVLQPDNGFRAGSNYWQAFSLLQSLWC